MMLLLALLLRTLTYAQDPYVTALVRLEDLAPEERSRLFHRSEGEWHCPVFSVPESVVITDRRSVIERLLRRSLTSP
jgi:hypothetical protein